MSDRLKEKDGPDLPLVGPSSSYPKIVDLLDFERQAKAVLPPMVWDYLSGGAADELTLRWNRESYDRLRLNPRVLVDVSSLDTQVTLLGRRLSFPILLAPTAYQQMMHPEGELATVQGASHAEATMVLSSFSTVDLETVAAAAACPLWFQLYINPDREFTRDLVRRAEAAKYQALVVTVDTPVLGPRYRELRSAFSLPTGLERANLRGMTSAAGAHRPNERNIFSAVLDSKVTWKDIEWLRSLTTMPVLLKGILNPDDAERAVQAGAAGIVVSNHGARNLDTVPATIDSLPEVVARVKGQIPILVDGGIRRGTDVLKALALGATAVLIGRPYVYGLAVEGAVGVARVVTILRRELEMAMALSGRTTLGAIDATVLWR